MLSDCYLEGSGTSTFQGLGGSWLVVFNGRCGVLLDPGMANMWRRGVERRHDSPDGRSLAVVVPCAGRGFRGKVLSLVSVYGPVSGAGFDDERRVMFDSLSVIWGLLPERSVWIIGGDFNAEIGFRGVGEESTLGIHAHGRRTRSGRQMMEWAQGEELRFLLTFSRQVCRDTWFPRRVSRDMRLIACFVGLAIIGFGCRRLCRPNRVSLRGSGDAANVARSALATVPRSSTDELQMSNPQLGLRLCRWVWVLPGLFWGRNLRRLLDL